MLKKVMLSLTAIASLAAASTTANAQFTSGNLVIYRVGEDGRAVALNATATAVVLDEFTISGAFVQSVALPTAGATAVTASGTATSEGFLTRSIDGNYVVFGGYRADVGLAAVAGTSAATNPRVAGRIDGLEATNLTTTFGSAGFSGSNIRGVASVDGSRFWAGGTGSAVGNSGVWTETLGNTTGTQIFSGNFRAPAIFNSQLYVSTGAGTNSRVGLAGTGLPTGADAFASLPGLPTTGEGWAYYFADLDAGVAGLDTLYLARQAAGIEKFSLVGGTWTSNGAFDQDAAHDVFGLTARLNGGIVDIYMTNGARLFTLSDATGYNAAFSSPAFTDLATAATNNAFRGVAFTPTAAVPEPTSFAIFGLAIGGVAARFWSRRRRQLLAQQSPAEDA